MGSIADLSSIPIGLCGCGCGQPTELAPRTVPRYGWTKGQPMRYIRFHQNRRRFRSIHDRFWAKVQKTETCWLWAGTLLGGSGYGQIQVNGRKRTVHQVAWELANGESIPEGMVVCHRCDVNYPLGDLTWRRCVRPDHLFLGTPSDNMQDALAKGRFPVGDRQWTHQHPERVLRGEQHGCAKLTEDDVRQIRTALARHENRNLLADQYEVSRATIAAIAVGRLWKHVD